MPKKAKINFAFSSFINLREAKSAVCLDFLRKTNNQKILNYGKTTNQSEGIQRWILY